MAAGFGAGGKTRPRSFRFSSGVFVADTIVKEADGVGGVFREKNERLAALLNWLIRGESLVVENSTYANVFVIVIRSKMEATQTKLIVVVPMARGARCEMCV